MYVCQLKHKQCQSVFSVVAQVVSQDGSGAAVRRSPSK